MRSHSNLTFVCMLRGVEQKTDIYTLPAVHFSCRCVPSNVQSCTAALLDLIHIVAVPALSALLSSQTALSTFSTHAASCPTPTSTIHPSPLPPTVLSSLSTHLSPPVHLLFSPTPISSPSFSSPLAEQEEHDLEALGGGTPRIHCQSLRARGGQQEKENRTHHICT